MNYTIYGEFPTLNEVIKVSKVHYGAYAQQKKKFTKIAKEHIAESDEIKGLCDWVFIWHRKDRRNDPDNIQVGTKYILDAFVEKGIIENDGWKNINSIAHFYKVDKQNPRVEIYVNKVVGLNE